LGQRERERASAYATPEAEAWNRITPKAEMQRGMDRECRRSRASCALSSMFSTGPDVPKPWWMMKLGAWGKLLHQRVLGIACAQQILVPPASLGLAAQQLNTPYIQVLCFLVTMAKSYFWELYSNKID
jgi:hypothetical protein